MKGYVINLARNRNKLDVIKNQPHFQEVFTVLDAIDAKGKRIFDINHLFDYRKAFDVEGRPLAMGEICCTLSHNLAYQKIAEDDSLANNDFCLIAEDDIILIDGWYEKVKLIEKAIKNLPSIKVVSMQISNINDFNKMNYDNNPYKYPVPRVSKAIKVDSLDFELFQQYDIELSRGAAFYMIRKSEAIRLTKLNKRRKDYLHADFWEFKLGSSHRILYTNPVFAYAIEGTDEGLIGQRNLYSQTYKLNAPLKIKITTLYNKTIGRLTSYLLMKCIEKNLSKNI